MKTSVHHALRQALQALESEKAHVERSIVMLRSAVHAHNGKSRQHLRVVDGGAKRKPMSAERRKAVSRWMSRYWAKRRRMEAKKAA